MGNTELDLIDFLAQWPYKKAPDEAVLLGIQIFWWNRIGGIMQFIGASFIIAEIVGLEKISKYSKNISYILGLIIVMSLLVILTTIIGKIYKGRINTYVISPISSLIGVLVALLAIFLARNIRRILDSSLLNKLLQVISVIFAVFGAIIQLLAA
ncbi:putative membrane protein [Skermanella aerolata]|uniref:hypothetical protein n=1 Tax=Skermanella aerolata TaxID=393310 RepID=UPI003D24BC89